MAPHILEIPLELRYTVFDHLFSQAVSRPSAESQNYRLPNEWPQTDIGDFISISLACRQLRRETVPFFEKFYLPGAKLYFDKIPELYMAHRAIGALVIRNPEYNNITYSIRSYPSVLMTLPPDFIQMVRITMEHTDLVSMATEDVHTYDNSNLGVGTYVCRNCESRLTIFDQQFLGFEEDKSASSKEEVTKDECKMIATRVSRGSTRTTPSTPDENVAVSSETSSPSPGSTTPPDSIPPSPPAPKAARIGRFRFSQDGVDMTLTWCREDTKTLYSELSGLMSDMSEVSFGSYTERTLFNRYATKARRLTAGLESVAQEKLEELFGRIKATIK